MILVKTKMTHNYFYYVYSLHVSGSHVPIIRRIIVSMRHLAYVTPDDGHMAARNMLII